MVDTMAPPITIQRYAFCSPILSQLGEQQLPTNITQCALWLDSCGATATDPTRYTVFRFSREESILRTCVTNRYRSLASEDVALPLIMQRLDRVLEALNSWTSLYPSAQEFWAQFLRVRVLPHITTDFITKYIQSESNLNALLGALQQVKPRRNPPLQKQVTDLIRALERQRRNIAARAAETEARRGTVPPPSAPQPVRVDVVAPETGEKAAAEPQARRYPLGIDGWYFYLTAGHSLHRQVLQAQPGLIRTLGSKHMGTTSAPNQSAGTGSINGGALFNIASWVQLALGLSVDERTFHASGIVNYHAVTGGAELGAYFRLHEHVGVMAGIAPLVGSLVTQTPQNIGAPDGRYRTRHPRFLFHLRGRTALFAQAIHLWDGATLDVGAAFTVSWLPYEDRIDSQWSSRVALDPAYQLSPELFVGLRFD